MAEDVSPPWGFDLLTSQSSVRATWKLQLFGSMVLGGYAWDIIVSLPGDCNFIVNRRWNYVTLIYLINRLSCIVTLTNFWLFSVYQGSRCVVIYKLGGISEPVTIFTSQALLLVRVRALFPRNYGLLVFMTLLLFAAPTLDFTYAIITTAYNLPGNVGCMFGPSSPYIYLVFIFQGVFDCLCFLLCTYKLYTLGHEGGYIGIGKELLNGGMVYYIPNVITQIATIVLTAQIGHEDQFLLPLAADAVASAQALRITRRLWKSGQKRPDLTDSSLQDYQHMQTVASNQIPSLQTVVKQNSAVHVHVGVPPV